jgi:hypothetical protein
MLIAFTGQISAASLAHPAFVIAFFAVAFPSFTAKTSGQTDTHASHPMHLFLSIFIFIFLCQAMTFFYFLGFWAEKI